MSISLFFMFLFFYIVRICLCVTTIVGNWEGTGVGTRYRSRVQRASFTCVPGTLPLNDNVSPLRA